MEISLLLMQQIAQLFLILIMGYAVVKVGLLKASDSRVLSVVMVYLVTPCVIINAFQIDDTPEIRKGLLYSMAIAAAIHVVLLVLSALLSRPLKLDAVEHRWSVSATRATAMCTCASCAASVTTKRGSASCTKTWTGPMPKPIASAASPPASTASGYRILHKTGAHDLQQALADYKYKFHIPPMPLS